MFTFVTYHFYVNIIENKKIYELKRKNYLILNTGTLKFFLKHAVE